MRSDVILARVHALADAANKDRIRKDILVEQRKVCSEDLDKTRAGLLRKQKTRELLNALIDQRKRSTLDRIEQLVTHGLRSVFENDAYVFSIITREERKQIAYAFQLGDNVFTTDEILDARGGALGNLIAFLLAVIVQAMLDPKAKLMLIDERFRNVPVKALPNVAILLNELSVKMGIQFIQVTQQEPLGEGADTLYLVTRDTGGVAVVHKKK